MDTKPAQWRLIVSEPMSGPENMAVDEALLNSFDPAGLRPVLRLYGWEPPALSLGRFQKAAEVLDLERCDGERIPVVRRITGGGVIYHADELTYSLVCSPSQIPPASSVKDSFRVLTGFLLAFYRRLGLSPIYAVDAVAEQSCLGQRTPFCFAGRETFDILLEGRKIGGNAQRRLKSVIFQHGSIPLVNRAPQGLSYMRERHSDLAAGTVSLSELGVTLDREGLLAALQKVFQEHLQVQLSADGLTLQEQAEAKRLLQKYRGKSWNRDGEEQ